MKRRLFILLLTLLPMVASADAVEIDGIYYNLDSKGKIAKVTYGSWPTDFYENSDGRYTGSIVIPESVEFNGNKYSVTSIDFWAFTFCISLTSVTIPNSVTSIGSGAFRYCTGLTSVTIPNSVTSIGSAAFRYCTGLTSITIPNSVTSIESYAFHNCSGLTSITIPNNVTSIEGYAFWNCSSLTSITIPNSVTSIENSAFSSCSGLTSLTIPNSVTSIGDYAFYGCSGLTTLTIPNSVTSIGSYAFYGCRGLTSLTLPNSVTSIGGWAFSGCTGLTSSITIPNSVTSIGYSAFSGCAGLTSIKVESGNTIYDSRNNCNAIIETSSNTLIVGCKNTKIPNSVMSISVNAFRACSGLTSLTIPNSVTSIGGGAFSGCTGLASLTIPNSVTSIDGCAFEDCRGLTSITIPNSVTSIGGGAFGGCTSFECVTSLSETPPLLYDNSFSNYNIPLYVPETAIETYQTTSPWSNFTQIRKLEQCAKPTIAFQNGEIQFSCETEEVEFIYSYTTPASSSNNTGSKFLVPTKLTITVYAKKEGYLDSETVTADIDVRGLIGDVDGDGEVDIADAVRIVNLVVGKIDALARPAKEVKDEKEPQ